MISFPMNATSWRYHSRIGTWLSMLVPGRMEKWTKRCEATRGEENGLTVMPGMCSLWKLPAALEDSHTYTAETAMLQSVVFEYLTPLEEYISLNDRDATARAP